MKKLMIVLAFVGLSLSSQAQAADPVQKHSIATNSFWSNWFIQVGGNWNAWYSNQEHGLDGKSSPFKKFRSNPGTSIAIGKWFTPGLGLRTKFSGIWGKSVNDVENYGNGNKYWVLNEQILFNTSNLICGYNPNRVWNFIPFIGGGVSRTMSHNLYSMNLNAGILNTFRLSRKVLLNVEIGWNRFEYDIDGSSEARSGIKRTWESKDNNIYGEIGLTFNLGKTTWSSTPDIDAIKSLSQSQIDALNAQLNDANIENERLKSMLANQKPIETKTIKEFVTTSASVFFYLNKTNIASKKDLVNVREIAKYAKENGYNINVTGYADSETGKPERNQWLSEKRAETVANELVKMGVSRDKIVVMGKGGVNELSPISFNRRVIVQILE